LPSELFQIVISYKIVSSSMKFKFIHKNLRHSGDVSFIFKPAPRAGYNSFGGIRPAICILDVGHCVVFGQLLFFLHVQTISVLAGRLWVRKEEDRVERVGWMVKS